MCWTKNLTKRKIIEQQFKTYKNNLLRTNILSHFKKESISSIQFNGKIINMMLPSKICINFYIQVFSTFSRITVFYLEYNFIFKSPSSFFCLDLKITISIFFTLSGILFGFNQLTRCFKSALARLFSFLIELLWGTMS